MEIFNHTHTHMHTHRQQTNMKIKIAITCKNINELQLEKIVQKIQQKYAWHWFDALKCEMLSLLFGVTGGNVSIWMLYIPAIIFINNAIVFIEKVAFSPT